MVPPRLLLLTLASALLIQSPQFAKGCKKKHKLPVEVYPFREYSLLRNSGPWYRYPNKGEKGCYNHIKLHRQHSRY